jgi:hypothetical protein
MEKTKDEVGTCSNNVEGECDIANTNSSDVASATN